MSAKKKILDFRELTKPKTIDGQRWLFQSLCTEKGEVKNRVRDLNKLGYNARSYKVNYNVGVRYPIYFKRSK